MLEPILERRISSRAFTGPYILGGLAAVGTAVVTGVFAPLLLPLALLPPAGVFVYSRMAMAGNRYRLFPDRLEVESGLLTRRIENVELFRVRDVGLRQGVMGRLANFGDVYLQSTDASTPDVRLTSVDAPKQVYEEVRRLVSESRAGHRTLILEQGQALDEG